MSQASPIKTARRSAPPAAAQVRAQAAAVARVRGPCLSRMTAAAAIVLLATAVSRPLRAQQSPPDAADPERVQLRNDCRLAAQVLTTGQPAPKREWALATIPDCGGDAPAAVAATWRLMPADSTTLDLLVAASVHRLDARTLAAASDVAGDRGAPTATRLAALRTLASYALPGAVVSSGDVAGVLSDTAATSLPLIGRVDHPALVTGAQPPSADAPAAVWTLFASLAANEPAPVGTLAGALQTGLIQPPGGATSAAPVTSRASRGRAAGSTGKAPRRTGRPRP